MNFASYTFNKQDSFYKFNFTTNYINKIFYPNYTANQCCNEKSYEKI